nr:hypothetical protein [uncultured Desulfobacter sp.]
MNVNDHPNLKPGDFLNTKEAAKIIDSTPGTMEVWRHLGKGPKFCKFGRNVRYYRPHLLEYAMNRCVTSTTQATVNKIS